MKPAELPGSPLARWLVVALGGLAAIGLVLAAEPARPLADPVRVGGALFVVLGVLFLASNLARKFSSRLKGVLPKSSVKIEVAGTKGIGGGRVLLVVEVAGESFLLSSGKEGVAMLARLAPEERSQEPEAG